MSDVAPSAQTHTPKTFRLLFVCLGNICRSPAAEGVMQKLVDQAGLTQQVFIDSAGTEGWHTGKPADHRMRDFASRRGYDLTSRARQVKTEDRDSFDLILVMDRQNMSDLARFHPGREHRAKVRLFCEYCTDHQATEVPDPYYGGAEGFNEVLDLLEDGCKNLLHHIQQQLNA